MKQAIVNGRIIGSATAGRGYVEWDGGVITAVGEGDYQGDAGLVTDAGGDWVSPGFIDIHTAPAVTISWTARSKPIWVRRRCRRVTAPRRSFRRRWPARTRTCSRRSRCSAVRSRSIRKGRTCPGCISKAPISPTTNAARKIRATCAIRVPKSTMRFLPPATIFAGCRWLPSSTVRSNWDGCCARKGFWRR